MPNADDDKRARWDRRLLVLLLLLLLLSAGEVVLPFGPFHHGHKTVKKPVPRVLLTPAKPGGPSGKAGGAPGDLQAGTARGGGGASAPTITPTLTAIANTLVLGADGIVPGDVLQRVFDLAGSAPVASVTLTTVPLTNSVLDTDLRNGLQMSIDRCQVSWAPGPGSGSYLCPGATVTVLSSSPWIGAVRPLTNLSLTSGGTLDHLRVTLVFPSAATNGLAGKSSAVLYTFASA